MKKKTVWAIILLLAVGILSINLPAQNRYYYKMDNIQAEHYISAARAEVQNNNLNLALTYAQKAVQANSWSKKAWDNYNDIVKKMVEAGGVKDFTAPVADTMAPPAEVQAQAPAPSDDDGSQFEGC
ncbi:hypothetical protein [Sulfurospirillum sp. 1612]|uniref:hypothetical protein n=1 Tax=Sulfurospirillum sp. 1612 TaxID=3094835 RepID=UPI002F928249